MDQQLPATEITALLGRGTQFEGKLHFEGRVRIDGVFKGEIQSDDTLVIGEGAEVHAEIDGERYDPQDDPSWASFQALGAASGKDGDCLRANISIASVLRTSDEVFQEPGLMEKVMELGGDFGEAPTLGPTRGELLEIVNG